MAKHRERLLALQTLYSLSFTPVESEAQLEKMFLHTAETSNDRETAHAAGFAWELIKGVWARSGELDALLEKYSLKRPLTRVGRMEHILLHLALYELVYLKTEPPIVKKESILLAREFGLEQSRSYIAGILDAAGRNLPLAS